ncbi:MAG: hypothetical protein GX410_01865 [Elusimicrobia bacterium]|nr:hypothetical protein [Elusimicrobiota bacterium]
MIKVLRAASAALICGLALLMPYRLRVLYGKAIGWLLQLLHMAFGWLARRLLDSLGIRSASELMRDNGGSK